MSASPNPELAQGRSDLPFSVRAMAETEDDFPEVKNLARWQTLRRVLAVALPVLLLLSPFLWFATQKYRRAARVEARRQADILPEAKQAGLAGLIEEAERMVDRADVGLGPSIEANELVRWRPGSEPCEEPPMAPLDDAGKNYVKSGSIDGVYFGFWKYQLVEPGQPVVVPDFAGPRAEIAYARQAIAIGEASRETLADIEQLLEGRHWSQIVVLLADDFVKPTALITPNGASLDKAFGSVVGRVFLIDAITGVRCVGDVDARISDMVEFEYLTFGVLDDYGRQTAANAAVTRDFEVNLRKNIVKSLRSAKHEPLVE